MDPTAGVECDAAVHVTFLSRKLYYVHGLRASVFHRDIPPSVSQSTAGQLGFATEVNAVCTVAIKAVFGKVYNTIIPKVLPNHDQINQFWYPDTREYILRTPIEYLVRP